MKKFVINYSNPDNHSGGSKARKDVNAIAKSCGYEVFFFTKATDRGLFFPEKNNKTFLQKSLRPIRKLFLSLKTSLSIPSKSEILIQYPPRVLSLEFIYLSCFIIKLKRCRISIIIHDLACYSKTHRIYKLEASLFNMAHKLIMHTPNMKKEYRNANVATPIELLYLFDYLTDEEPSQMRTANQNKIVFAGALSKSAFLQHLPEIATEKVKFLLCGFDSSHIVLNENITFEGEFSPENINFIQGDWGLVWDGDSLDSCSGVFGEYLRINSPHKTSLYIAAGLPVIIWKEAALAPYIVENKLGIAVSSIRDIEQKISSLSENEIDEIKKNVSLFSAKLRHGESLKSLLI